MPLHGRAYERHGSDPLYSGVTAHVHGHLMNASFLMDEAATFPVFDHVVMIE